MIWLYRLWLGLPARAADVEEIRRTAPELLDGGAPIPSLIGLPPWMWHLIRREVAKSGRDLDLRHAVKNWVQRNEGASREIGGRMPPASCPLPECPLKSAGSAQEAKTETPGKKATASEPRFTELMRLGGGPGRKPLLDQFLDVVGQVHADAGKAQTVIVTDPYILRDRGEAGVGGGFDNLCKYIARLQLTQRSKFRFVMPPSPKGAAGKSKWEETFAKHFPEVTVDYFDGQLVFHDRLYAVKHEGGARKGVFGPSLNGLGATDIALMGEIEMSGALDVLMKWLD